MALAVLKDKIEARVKAIADARAIVAKSQAEKRSLTPEEETAFAKVEKDVEDLGREITALEKDDKRAAWLERMEASMNEDATRRRSSGNDDPSRQPGNDGANTERDEQAAARSMRWNAWSKLERNYLPPVIRSGRKINFGVGKKGTSGHRSSRQYQRAMDHYLRHGIRRGIPRALMRSDDEERGGYFITDEQMSGEMIKNADDDVLIQRMSRLFVVPSARNLGMYKRVNKFSAWNWGSELHDVTEHLDTSLSYGKKSLHPHYITGAARISRDLLRSSTMPIREMVLDEARMDFSEVMEQAYLYGHGANQCLGVFTNSPDGITDARDIVVEATDSNANDFDPTEQFSFDTFTRALMNQKIKYRKNSRWLLHRHVITRVATLKDNEGQYLWQPSRQIGIPNMILGQPVDESEWLPHQASAGNYFGILADWQYYYIAYALDMEIQVLNELVARQNQIEYLMRVKVDALPIQEEAFTRLQYATE